MPELANLSKTLLDSMLTLTAIVCIFNLEIVFKDSM